ncbi:hypothetical protein Bca52824_007444 [Brassica carinata]|uniref:Protein kinase domain-containing protein n=1 Tax=Brassica carinata TaxID=52824 RepID=A0A8X7W7W4_BRACI|nr:hypothetical protein Bca52824_007444 [Brassica carinata]
MEPRPNDAETVETHSGATTDVQLLLTPKMLAAENVPENLSHEAHDENYVQYNISGNIFEVLAKYKPPIMILGRGAYGIVCDLQKVIASNQELTKDHYQYLLCQILRGLKYIHSANVLHRNLKPSNLLVSMKCELKICGFALARAPLETHAVTEYVAATRWYHAPELLLNSSTYTSAIDMWSVGCIFVELMTGTLLFPGKDHVHQLRLIMELIGSPTEEDIGSLNESAKQYLRQLPCLDRQSFLVKFPNVPHLAIDLMEKMLKFDPRQRITVEDALAHPYLTTLHDITDEPVCMKPFEVDLKEQVLTAEQIKELIYQEALAFNP